MIQVECYLSIKGSISVCAHFLLCSLLIQDCFVNWYFCVLNLFSDCIFLVLQVSVAGTHMIKTIYIALNFSLFIVVIAWTFSLSTVLWMVNQHVLLSWLLLSESSSDVLLLLLSFGLCWLWFIFPFHCGLLVWYILYWMLFCMWHLLVGILPCELNLK